jgi:type IV pilus assembly protein PilP
MNDAPFTATGLMRRIHAGALVAFIVIGSVTIGRAQAASNSKAPTPSPAPAAVTPPAPANAPAPVAAPSNVQGYAYNPAGRRDPFVSLMNGGVDQGTSQSSRPDGVPGLTVDEVAIRGIVQNRGAYVAMIQAPDGKSYTVRAGDRLFDGVVKAVTSGAVIFVQQVNDPLSLVKQREIRKPLRPTEEGK